MNIYECAIDNGFGDTKYKSEKLMSKFRSQTYQTYDDLNDNSVLDIDGIRYKIGCGQPDIDLQKTRKQTHKVCTIAVLSKLLEQNNNGEFRIALGQPLMQYKNKELREEFKNYIIKPGYHIVKINGIEKRITIKDACVCPQGGASLYTDLKKCEEYKRSLNAIVDWGSMTINGFISEGLNPIPETMFTVNLGTLILFNGIKTALNERLGLNIQDYEIPYLLINTPKQMEPIIHEVEDLHFEQILNEMRKKNWSMETRSIYGVGGGWIVIKDIARRYISNLEIANNPVYANVIGMYNMGKVAVWK